MVYMEKALDKILAKSEAKTSILIKEIDTERVLYAKDIDTQVVSASIIKVPIMLGVLDLVCKKELSLDDTISISEAQLLEGSSIHCPNDYTIEELITWMIITSDNTATNALLRTYGMDYFNTYLGDVLKVKDTYIERYMLDSAAVASGLNNYTSNLDMFRIFKKLYCRQILDDKMCLLAQDILLRQRDFKKLLSGVYKSQPFAHKTGDLKHLQHDVGVLSKAVDYYIGVFTWDTPDVKGDRELMRNIGKVIFDGLNSI